MRVVSIGVDHTTAPVEVREAFAFGAEDATRFLCEETAGLPERLLLSTCNRTEFLAVAREEEEDPVGRLVELLNKARGIETERRNGYARVHRGEEAIRHLFRVACGLESMVLGEAQILGQVKEAGEAAAACGAAGPVLRRALETAVRVAKRARTKTAIGEGAVSIASAAVDLARRVFGDLDERSALVVGAGDTGRLVARHLRKAGIARMTVANRTLGRAQDLAQEVGAEPWGLCGVPPALREADVVVCSTGSETPILSRDEIRLAMKTRKNRMLLLLDIAVPRDVDPAVATIDNVFLHDIDTLNHIVDRNLEVRQRAVPAVEAMVEEAGAAFLAWERQLSVVPTIKELRRRFEEVRREELANNLKRIPPEAREQAERLTESLVARILHEPTVTLRRASSEKGGGKDLIAALRRLFGMDRREKE
jgi:glutamyl-tRNA reductase